MGLKYKENQCFKKKAKKVLYHETNHRLQQDSLFNMIVN